VHLNGSNLQLPASKTVLLNKPAGFVCSRNGQGSPTIYQLLPAKLHSLKPVGRLDKDSSGLLLLTNDGDLANRLTHPRYQKTKVYQVQLDRPLAVTDQRAIQQGIKLEDGSSHLSLKRQGSTGQRWQITMQEGRNRQIRRTFAARGYQVQRLERTEFGPYTFKQLGDRSYKLVS
jgi:23S rRNA pseudouridine2605 synthase